VGNRAGQDLTDIAKWRFTAQKWSFAPRCRDRKSKRVCTSGQVAGTAGTSCGLR